MILANLPLLIALLLPSALGQGWGGKKTAVPVESPTPPPVQEIALFPSGLPLVVGDVPEGLANITAQGCNACHFQAHDDWAQSGHAQAGDSPLFKAAIKRAGNSTACTQCHRPLQAQHARLAAGYIEGDLSRPHIVDNPSFDATLMAEGVGCAACHVREGQIVSTRQVTGAPHPVGLSSTLGQSTLCATCHQLSYPESDKPFYDTFGEWSASPHAAAGIQCQDCHMPPRPGVATASRFAASPDHRFEAKLSRALTVLVDLSSDTLQRGEATRVGVRLQNTGAGHHVPTGSPYKTLQIQLQLHDASGAVLVQAPVEVLGRTVSADPPYTTQDDNRIPAGGEHEFTAEILVGHKIKAGPVALVVQATQGSDAPTILTSIPLELN